MYVTRFFAHANAPWGLFFIAAVVFCFLFFNSEARDEARKRHEDQGIPFFEVSVVVLVWVL